MKPKSLYLFQSVVALLFGISLVLVPQQLLNIYVDDSRLIAPMTALMARNFGALLIALAVGLLLSRDSQNKGPCH